jgi:hypothetical protein
MATVAVSEVAKFLERLEFDRRSLNMELDALGKVDFQALGSRFIMGIINDRELIQTVLDRWVQKQGSQASIATLCKALENNQNPLASGKSSLKYIEVYCFTYFS